LLASGTPLSASCALTGAAKEISAAGLLNIRFNTLIVDRGLCVVQPHHLHVGAEQARMTLDTRTLLPIADHAVTIAGEIIRTTAPGVITANFLHGIPLCGVSLGLVDKDMPRVGVIDLPFLGTRYTAAEGAGAQANGVEIQAGDTRDLDAAIVSIGDYAVGNDAQERNRPRLALTHELAARVQRMYGSAAVDLAWVAHGKTDACIMLSNNPWDTAAGVLIAREAGAAVVDIDGSPHSMSSLATIAAGPKLVADLVELIAEAQKIAKHSLRTAE
jgi:hypothetical protein